MHRVLVIGLDGATLDLIEPWVKQGALPNLGELMRRGRYGLLRSVLPVISSAAWPSFMTGVNPGKHGVYDFMVRQSDGYRLRPVHAGQIRAPSLWRLLSEQHRRVAVVNVPMTYPPEPVNGVLVSGLGTPDYKPFTYPADLGPEWTRAGYRVNKHQAYRPGNEDAFLAEVDAVTQSLGEQSVRLLRQEDWDFFMVVFRDTDELAHFFWRYMDENHPCHSPADTPYRTAILDYYRLVDRWVGQLLEAAGPAATVFVVSDHGSGPLYRDVFLNEWLAQEGFLAFRSGVSASPLRAALARLGMTRDGVSRALRRAGLGRAERWIKDLMGNRIEVLPRSSRTEFPDAVDWSRTRAYSFGNLGQIYLNLSGREPEGIVEPQNYQDTLNELEAALTRLRDPDDGHSVVTRIVRQAEAFQGPHARSGPDLIVFMRDLAYITRQRFEFGAARGRIFGPSSTHESGGHRLDGVVIACGPAIKAAEGRQSISSILDMAPTIAHLLGCPVPNYMDGQVHLDWLEEPGQPIYVDRPALADGILTEPGAGLTDEEEVEIMDRLEGLGYMG